MNFWPFTTRTRQPEARSVGYEDFHGRALDSSRIPMSADQAAGLAPVFCAVRLVSETLGSLPIHVTQSKPDGTRGPVDHPLDRLFDSPNGAMSWSEFFECVVSHEELRGNSYSEIIRDGAGRPTALWPLKPGTVRPERDGARVKYHVSTRSGVVEADQSRVLHLKFNVLSSDGITGADPVALLRADLDAARQARDHAANYLRRGGSPSAVLTHPSELSAQAAKRLRDDWEKIYGGSRNAGACMTLEEGMTFAAVGHDGEKTQLLQSRQFSVNDVARIWRVPPHLLADLTRSTFSNAESEIRSFVTLSLRPRIVRIEQALDRALLSDAERAAGLRIMLNADALLRGDTESRYRAHSIGIQNGWLSPNEVRQLEDLPAVEGLDSYQITPGAGIASGEPEAPATPGNEDNEDES